MEDKADVIVDVVDVDNDDDACSGVTPDAADVLSIFVLLPLLLFLFFSSSLLLV